MTRASWLVSSALVACAHTAAGPSTPQADTEASPVIDAPRPPPSGSASGAAASPPLVDAALPSADAPPAASVGARAGQLILHPLPDAARDAKIRQQFGDHCHLERICGPLWGIDCDAAVDGPYYYVKSGTLASVANCGGYCQGGRCTNCPPREWTCATY